MAPMFSAAEVVRHYRMGFAVTLLASVLVAVACIAMPSNAWMHASAALLAATALTDLFVARWVAAPTDADTLRREIRLLRWSPLWYVLPMVGAPLLLVEGVSRLLGEHTPLPIAWAVLGVGIGTAIVCQLEARKLARSPALADTNPARMD
jgi:hypothetical protein